MISLLYWLLRLGFHLFSLGRPLKVLLFYLVIDVFVLNVVVNELLMVGRGEALLVILKLSKESSLLEKIDEKVGVLSSEDFIVDENWLSSFAEFGHEDYRQPAFHFFVVGCLHPIDFLNSDVVVPVIHQTSFQNLIRGIFPVLCLNLYIQLNITKVGGVDMSHPKIIQNTFDPRPLKNLLSKLEFVSFDQSHQNVMKEIEQLSPSDYLWAVGRTPAYFVQHQVKSAAVIKVKDIVLVVWKPKYIEYPSLVKFPDLKEKIPNNIKIEIEDGSTTTSTTNEAFVTFLGYFYGTFFHSDENFQTNLITYSKHFMSKISKHSYWHAIIDEADELFVTQVAKMSNICKVRISGIKEGYAKTLLLFSFQGERGSIITMAKDKWMQILSFVGMIIIFYSIVACNADDTEGLCAYRQEMSLGGAGIMLALIGLRYGQKKGKDKKKAKKASNTEGQNINKED